MIQSCFLIGLKKINTRFFLLHVGASDMVIDDPNLQPTDEDIAAEEEAEPTMMRDAEYWDDSSLFLLISCRKNGQVRPTTLRRIGRQRQSGSSMQAKVAHVPRYLFALLLLALASPCARSAGAKVVKNCKELPGAHRSWVEH